LSVDADYRSMGSTCATRGVARQRDLGGCPTAAAEVLSPCRDAAQPAGRLDGAGVQGAATCQMELGSQDSAQCRWRASRRKTTCT